MRPPFQSFDFNEQRKAQTDAATKASQNRDRQRDQSKTVTCYPIVQCGALLSKLTLPNISVGNDCCDEEENSVRYIVLSDGRCLVAREGTPSGANSIPAHYQMTGQEYGSAYCLAAGNLFFRKNATGKIELYKVSNKSGDFIPSVDTLKWILYILLNVPIANFEISDSLSLELHNDGISNCSTTRGSLNTEMQQLISHDQHTQLINNNQSDLPINHTYKPLQRQVALAESAAATLITEPNSALSLSLFGGFSMEASRACLLDSPPQQQVRSRWPLSRDELLLSPPSMEAGRAYLLDSPPRRPARSMWAFNRPLSLDSPSMGGGDTRECVSREVSPKRHKVATGAIGPDAVALPLPLRLTR